MREFHWRLLFHGIPLFFLTFLSIFFSVPDAAPAKPLVRSVCFKPSSESEQVRCYKNYNRSSSRCNHFMPLCMSSLSNASKTFRNGLAANATHTFCETKPCKSVQKVAMKCNGRLWGRILQPFKFSDRRWILAPVIANKLFDTKIPIPWSAWSLDVK